MIARMSDQGAGSGPKDGIPRSKIADYAEMTTAPEQAPPPSTPAPNSASAESPSPLPVPAPRATDGEALSPRPEGYPAPEGARSPEEAVLIRRRRHEGAALLGELRRTAVLLPLGEDGSPLTGDFGGIRWIYAFSDEPALARFAIARGEGAREWSYERVLGARLLDVAIPAMPVPYGVALDVGGPEGEGALFPPVRGIVPDAAAVDVGMPSEDVGTAAVDVGTADSPMARPDRPDDNAELTR